MNISLEIKSTLNAIKRIRGIAVATIEDNRPLDDDLHRDRFRDYPLLWNNIKVVVEGIERSGVPIEHANPFKDLKELYGYLKSESRTWAGRRQIVNDFYEPLENKLKELLEMPEFDKPDLKIFLEEILPNKRIINKWDVFICHASEDKSSIVELIVQELIKYDLKVWYDQHILQIGDSLRRKIDEGLKYSRFGIVVLSPYFFQKKWPQLELDGLVQREELGQKVILPVWHNVTKEDVARYSLPLADKLAGSTNGGIEKLVKELIKVIKP